MLLKTRGIVIGTLACGESSIVTKIYTEVLGVRSYLVNGVRSARNQGKAALYQPLSLLEMTVYEKPRPTLQRIASAHLSYPYRHIPFSIPKTTIALFLAEILYKTLKEEKEDLELFNFLFESLTIFDKITTGVELFHLVFMVRLAARLGFGADSAESFAEQLLQARIPFDLKETGLAYQKLLALDYGMADRTVNSCRTALLDALTAFFALHCENFGSMRSLAVLRNL